MWVKWYTIRKKDILRIETPINKIQNLYANERLIHTKEIYNYQHIQVHRVDLDSKLPD
jgi:hypothetical protein